MTPESATWGASPADWCHFSEHLGLTEDLLPVVSRQDAVISSRSKLKALGKTPSLYNADGQVTGIGNWTNLRSVEAKISSWSRVSDYGICIQTRVVRGLDIDVADEAKAAAIATFIQTHLMTTLPARTRPNSGKCLLVVRVDGDIGKRSFPVDGGVVELLATGQQFVAVGTHPSGVEYEWPEGLPREIPEISTEDLDDLWSALGARFATGEGVNEDVSDRRRGESVEADDPVAEHLEGNGLALDGSDEVRVVVKCPWEAGHSGGVTGDTSSVWFRAGTNAYAFGHYRCLHASCSARTDDEFKTEVGYVEPMLTFDPVVLTQDEMDGAGGLAGAPMLRRVRGRPVATIENVVKALRVAPYIGARLGFDTFRDEIMYAPPGSNQWLQFTDKDYSRLRMVLGDDKQFQPVGREMVRDAVLLVASENPFDTAIEWVNQLHWDGVPRIETFLSEYMQAENTPYVRAVSRYLWSAMAGRVLVPGIKADMVLILKGNQGAKKSAAVKAMCPDEEYFTELSLSEPDDNLSRKMRGRLIAELGELQGLHTKELESIKAFITRTHENWVPKYREFATKFPRRLVFIGTTNQDEFLADETGNRRWLPVSVADDLDVDRIAKDRDQLWAEAAAMFLINGIEYRNAEVLAKKVHAKYTISDAWQPEITEWLDRPDPMTGEIPRTCEFLRVHDVLKNALSIEPRNVKKYDEMRVGKVLQALGYRKTKRRVNTQPVPVWEKPLPPDPT